MRAQQKAMHEKNVKAFEEWVAEYQEAEERAIKEHKMICEAILPRTGLNIGKGGGREWEKSDRDYNQWLKMQPPTVSGWNGKARRGETPPTEQEAYYLFINCPKCTRSFKADEKICPCGQERV